ncbi:MAG: exodeoxyribonuclease VII large subunit, partial [Spirochaetales bacterium]
MQVYTVARITGYLRDILESDALLADIWISGEISNMSESSAGHLYFTLKDKTSQMRCVLFNRKKLKIDIENGLAVVAHGSISIYEVSGAVQLYVDMIQPTGLGVLNMEFERLKAKLEEEGLFEPSRKRPLPAFPDKIGIVTSPGGAVLHDITNIIGRRYPVVELVLAPTTVQGESAVPGIINALNALNDRGDIDLIIIARGGGSIEDLWAFNDEKVARAIYSSKTPVISGVGHDTDFTIADFVADKRAPTPSAAAELAVRPKADFEEALRTGQRRLTQALRTRVLEFRNRFTRAARSYVFREPAHLLQRHRERVALLRDRLGSDLQAALAEQQQRVDEAGLR